MSDDDEDYDSEEREGEEDHFVEQPDSQGSDDDDDDEDGSGERMVMDPTNVKERIDAALHTLANLKNRQDKSQSRGDIIALLSHDLSEYHGYIQELSDYLLELFSPAECAEYMEASDRNRPLVIRTNTLKTTRKDLMEALGKRGASVEGIEWSKVAIKVTESTVPIGATPEYLAGHYMLQSAASLNPVMALAPLPNERVLDMSAAPGGKTTYIAQLMKNSGQIIANDLKPARQKATVANLHRMGVKNAIVCCYDGRKIPTIMKGFDRVLLDAPCSGLGVISRDQTVKLQRTVKDIQRIAHMQKELLLAAIDAVDHKSSSGGICVYSTCSISADENESVVHYALKRRFVRIIETGLEVGKPGFTRHKEKRFHPSLALTRRFYPHVHNMDGFYVAKIQKYAPGARGEDENDDGGGGGSGGDDDDEDHDDDDDDGDAELEEEKEEDEPVKPAPKKTKQAPPGPNAKAQTQTQTQTQTQAKAKAQTQTQAQPAQSKTKAKAKATTPAPPAVPQVASSQSGVGSGVKGKSPAAALASSKAHQSRSADKKDSSDDDSDSGSDEDMSPSRRATGSGKKKRKRRLSLTAIRELAMAERGRLAPRKDPSP